MRRVLMSIVSAAAVVSVTAAVLSMGAPVIAAAPAGDQNKLPVPGERDLAKSRKLVAEVYGADIKNAAQPAQKAQLAATLLKDAGEAEDPASRYVLLTGALNLAAGAGDVEKALAALEDLGAFDTDIAAMKIQAAEKLLAAAGKDAQPRVADMCLDAVGEAVGADDYDAARQLADCAVRSARKARDLKRARRAMSTQVDLKKLHAKYRRVQAALETLETDEDDPAANYTAGSFYCYVKGDWQRGLPMLARSEKEPVGSVARIELGGVEGAGEQNKLADAWWDLAAGRGATEAANIRAHAAAWYRRALPELGVLLRKRAEKRLSACREAVAEAGDTAVGAPPGPKTLTIDLPKGVKMKFVLIPAGSFMMGSPPDEEGRDGSREGPRHKVTITKPFYLSVTEVTQAQYMVVTGKNPSKYTGANRPVEMVSWHDAVAFCKRLSAAKKRIFRLPTEAEWEYACRAGTRTRFSFGDRDEDLHKYGNYADRTCTDPWKGKDEAHSDGHDRTAPVGSLKPNPWGLHDMHGNVWEWCADWYGNYAGAEAKDPTGPAAGDRRVLRGGSWSDLPRKCRSAFRIRLDPGHRNHYHGFRVAVSLSAGVD